MFKEILELLKATITDWLDDEAPRHAAALAYYTAFSLAPLLLIIIALVGLFVEREAVTGQIRQQMVNMLGQNSAEIVDAMLESVVAREGGGLAAVIGIVTALLGAAGLFGNLQAALNAMWEVEPKPGQGILGFIRTRFLSFTMILGIGFLLLVSLVLNSVVATLGNFITGLMPGMELLVNIMSFLLSFGVVTLLFAAIFRVLPDVEIAWRDVWAGAIGTALLFTLGQYLLGLYLRTSDPGAAYGAAGSLILLLLWVYYSAQIMLLGAEFTQVYARRYGSHIEPSEHAMWSPDAERAGAAAQTEEAEGTPARTAAEPSPRPAAQPEPITPRPMPVPSRPERVVPVVPPAAMAENGSLQALLIVVAGIATGIALGERRKLDRLSAHEPDNYPSRRAM